MLHSDVHDLSDTMRQLEVADGDHVATEVLAGQAGSRSVVRIDSACSDHRCCSYRRITRPLIPVQGARTLLVCRLERIGGRICDYDTCVESWDRSDIREQEGCTTQVDREYC